MVLMTDRVDATAAVALDHSTFIGQQRLRPHGTAGLTACEVGSN